MVQQRLLPELRDQIGALTSELEQVIHILEWVRIGEFMTKAMLDVATTVGLIERLAEDRSPRRICGFVMCGKLPSDAFEEFAEGRLAERVHEDLIKAHLGYEYEMAGHLSHDGTAIPAHERPARGQAKAPMPT